MPTPRDQDDILHQVVADRHPQVEKAHPYDLQDHAGRTGAYHVQELGGAGKTPDASVQLEQYKEHQRDDDAHWQVQDLVIHVLHVHIAEPEIIADIQRQETRQSNQEDVCDRQKGDTVPGRVILDKFFQIHTNSPVYSCKAFLL